MPNGASCRRARSAARGEIEPGVAHERVDLVRERDAHDRLAVAGAGDRDRRVVRPRAHGDQRRVADAARVLAVGAAGRGGRGDPPVGVAGDGADRVPALLDALGGAEPVVGGACRRPCSRAKWAAGSPTSITCRPSSSTARAAWIGLRMPVSAATAPAARSLPRMIDASWRIAPCSSSDAAAAGVEDRVVLEHDHGRLDRVERVTACVRAPRGRRRPRARTPSRARSRYSGRQVPAPPCTTIVITPGTIRQSSCGAGPHAVTICQRGVRHQRLEAGLRAPAPGPARRTTWRG